MIKIQHVYVFTTSKGDLFRKMSYLAANRNIHKIKYIFRICIDFSKIIY